MSVLWGLRRNYSEKCRGDPFWWLVRTCATSDMCYVRLVLRQTCAKSDMYYIRHVLHQTRDKSDTCYVRHMLSQTCNKSDMCYVRHVIRQTCDESLCFVFPFIHLCMCGVVLRWTCGGQESICGSQFSSFTIWTWGPNSGLRLGGRLLYPLTDPSSPPPWHPLNLIWLLRTIQNFLPAQNIL